MTHVQSSGAVVLSLSLLLLSACATEQGVTSSGPSSATGSTAPSSTSTTSTTSTSTSDASEDALQDCLSHVPKDGTVGERMLAEESCRREEALEQYTAGYAKMKSANRPAAGSIGDSYDACIARIPKDATSGQRMVAESSCRRDRAELPFRR